MIGRVVDVVGMLCDGLDGVKLIAGNDCFGLNVVMVV